ncbi:hypothetical protein BDZ45DRAFT_327791 [Acephala macrosclerotiorum]|nr:hypothetical protein BDZ45DRAFT_327791 [Acephala macrosclerotiorum]
MVASLLYQLSRLPVPTFIVIGISYLAGSSRAGPFVLYPSRRRLQRVVDRVGRPSVVPLPFMLLILCHYPCL